MGLVEIFADETYPDTTGGTLLRVATIAVFKTHLRKATEQLRQIRGLTAKRRLPALLEYLASAPMLGVIGETDMSLADNGLDGRDLYEDVGTIARRDNFWSQSIAYCVAFNLRFAIEEGWHINQVRVYYDPKDLKTAHRANFHTSLQTILSRLSARLSRQLDMPKCQVHVGRVREIRKNDANESLRLGVWCAHSVLRMPDSLGPESLPANFRMLTFSDWIAGLLRKKPTPFIRKR